LFDVFTKNVVIVPQTVLAFEGFLLVLLGNCPDDQDCSSSAHLPRLAYRAALNVGVAADVGAGFCMVYFGSHVGRRIASCINLPPPASKPAPSSDGQISVTTAGGHTDNRTSASKPVRSVAPTNRHGPGKGGQTKNMQLCSPNWNTRTRPTRK